MRFFGSPTDNSPTAPWLALLLLAMAVYAFGLGGQYIPTNGDEMVYAHIARETSETGRWLPLASELVGTRNTKPPLLFWQAMVAGDWGNNWQLWALRAPSLLYTLLTAAAVAWSVRLIRHSARDGLLAACIYLAFYSSFHYGRPYLTSAPETFWLSLPLFALLWRQTAQEHAPAPGWRQHLLFGLALGLGLAYKSFALIAPAAAAWWLALMLSAPRLTWSTLWRSSLKVGLSAALALGVFALWFALDPDPQAVWQEFIVAENAKKFSDARGYWQEALSFNGSSLWSQLLAYPVNAGLLAFATIGLAWRGWQGWRQPLATHQKILLAWAAVWLVVFLFPSQRTARYVIPAMPAIAMLLALAWRGISRYWFVPTLLLAAALLLVLGRIAWVAHTLAIASTLDWMHVLLTLGLGTITIVSSLLRPAWTRNGALLATLLVYACFNLTVAPLDGPVGRYDERTTAQLPPSRIAVPNSFNGQFERFHFLLPGAHDFIPYETGARRAANATPLTEELAKLLADYDAVVWIQSSQAETTAPCLPQCRVLGERWLLTSRHLPGEVRLDNLWHPQQWLFRREWLLQRAAP
jgi:4-amino-4-deoxy-L-arabinose transferase-like glycosyltransferase